MIDWIVMQWAGYIAQPWTLIIVQGIVFCLLAYTAMLLIVLVLVVITEMIWGEPGDDSCARDMAYGYIMYSDDVTISPAQRQAAARSYANWMAGEQAKNNPPLRLRDSWK